MRYRNLQTYLVLGGRINAPSAFFLRSPCKYSNDSLKDRTINYLQKVFETMTTKQKNSIPVVIRKKASQEQETSQPQNASIKSQITQEALSEVSSEKKESLKNKEKRKKQKEELFAEQEALLQSWVYLEQKSPFNFAWKKKPIDTNNQTRIIQFQGINRAKGLLQAELIEVKEEKKGKIKIGDKILFINDKRYPPTRKKRPLQHYLHKVVSISYWPVSSYRHKPESPLVFDSFNISGISERKEQPSNYIEIVGQLDRVWENYCEIKIWSPDKKKFFYVYPQGPYPYPDERGEFVWIKGKFDIEKQVVQIVEAEALAFVEEKELTKILKEKSS